MMEVVVLAALDTKGSDASFIVSRLRDHGLHPTVVDIGVLGRPVFGADISRREVAEAGGADIDDLIERRDRAEAVAVMERGAKQIVSRLHREGRLHGVFALGGGAGTTIGATAARDLPLGIPKVLLSTVASVDTSAYTGTSDIVLFPSIVDVAGINRISAMTYSRAADAFAAMVLGSGENEIGTTSGARTVAITMFGVTTACATRAEQLLRERGFEPFIFHATGIGGRTMERLIDEGFIDAVLDLTTTEWADEVVGGILSAGSDRLGAAARRGIPQVVSVGATDMVNFGPRDSVPERFAARKLYQHNSENTLMRASVDESRLIGEQIGMRVREATGPVTVLLPTRGVSALDAAGQPFEDEAARFALFDALAENLPDSVPIISVDAHINDEMFAAFAAETLMEHME